MTKPVQLISIFITIFILLSLTANFSHAQYLIRPIPDDPSDTSIGSLERSRRGSPELEVPEQITGYQPSLTFGDLLKVKVSSLSADLVNTAIATVSSDYPQNDSSRSAAVNNILAQLEASYRESQQEFLTNNQQSITNDQQITDNTSFNRASDEQPTTNPLQPTTISPTPFIPIPTLIAKVSEIIGNQSFDVASGKQSVSAQEQPTTNIGNISQNPPKTAYIIAVLGDSMVDTLGKDMPLLRQILKDAYPAYSFALLNYGQGATDMENGLTRLTQTSTYLDKNYQPLLSFKPDILVVESFAYNHWTGENYDLDRQWLTIAKIIDTIREKSPDTKIILAATIAPNALTFGDGVLNWPSPLKWQSAQITKTYLQNMVNFATSEHYPMADAYHPSLDPSGNGMTKYINGGDHLHPSDEGKLLFSQKIVEAIKTNNLIK